MKSLAIKTSNQALIKHLYNELSVTTFNDVYYTIKNFKNYTNCIVHYIGNDVSSFYDFVCNIVTNFVMDKYEVKMLKRLLNLYYFYFNDIEKASILNVCDEIIENKDYNEYDYRYEQIYIAIFDYLSSNKNIFIDGFIDFRLIKYCKSLTDLLDIGVKKYLIDKEYNEFISLLRAYISLNESSCNIVHAIYSKNNIVLLDENLAKIDVLSTMRINNSLCDISFSDNDYVLNCLLSLLPKRIIVHAFDDSDDEFINTLKMIFEKRLEFCFDCNICGLFAVDRNLLNHNIN